MRAMRDIGDPAVKKYILTDYQRRFFLTDRRWPSIISGWGTGKTMCGLQMGAILSMVYENNLGLVVRRKFTDLRDSTMKDFTRYTGIPVSSSAKEARVGSSVVLFRHADELTGKGVLQNVNLGWWMMEQAEEFPTDSQFTWLRGRLRREPLEISRFVPRDSVTGLCNRGSPFMRELTNKLIATPTRRGMIIANAHGHWWGWKNFIRTPIEDSMCVEATSFDNSGNLPADFIADLHRLERDAPRKYRQFVMNSHEDFDLEGAFWAKDVSLALSEGRVTNLPFDPALPVHTVWDFGIGEEDSTAIIFFQLCGKEIHIVDYYENNTEGMPFYAKILAEKLKGWIKGEDFAPVDVYRRSMQTGESLLTVAKKSGVIFRPLPKEKDKYLGIDRARGIFHRCWFDAKKTEFLIDALSHYQKERDDAHSTEAHPVFRSRALHDWSSHGADAFRSLSLAVEKKLGGSRMTANRVRQLQKQYGPPMVA